MASGDVVGVGLQADHGPFTLFAPLVQVPGGSTPAERTLAWAFDDTTQEYKDFRFFLYGYDGGGLTISVTVPGEDLRQAVTIGLAAAAEHGTPVGLTALPERVRDARDGWPAVPELVGATAAADMLKVSRQQVWNLIEGGSLPGQRVGRDWVIPAAAVRALVEKRSAGA